MSRKTPTDFLMFRMNPGTGGKGVGATFKV
jgi:hypothetical protein